MAHEPIRLATTSAAIRQPEAVELLLACGRTLRETALNARHGGATRVTGFSLAKPPAICSAGAATEGNCNNRVFGESANPMHFLIGPAQGASCWFRISRRNWRPP